MSLLSALSRIKPNIALPRQPDRLWQRLVEPAHSIVDRERWHQAQLLSSILIVLFALGLLAACGDLWLRWYGGSGIAVDLGSTAVLAVLYRLSRSRYERLAGWLTIFLVLAALFVALHFLPADPGALPFIVLPLLIGGLFLNPRGILIVFLASLVQILGLVVLGTQFTRDQVLGAAYLTIVAGVPVWVAARVRQEDAERIRAQSAELATNERYFHSLIENASDVIMVVDPNALIQFASPSVETTLGYAPYELVGKNAVELVEAQESERLSSVIAGIAARGGQERTVETRLRHKDGTWRVLEVTGKRVERAARPSIVINARDITERKRAETASQRRAEEFTALYETARAVASHQDLPSLFQTIVEQARILLSGTMVVLALYDTERKDLVIVAERASPLPAGTRMRLGQGVAGYVAKTREPVIINDYSEWQGRIEPLPGIPLGPKLGVPLLHAGELIGALLVVEEVNKRQFTEEDARLLSLLATPAASAVHNARLFDETSIRAQQLALLYDAGLTLNRVLEPQAQLQFIFEIAAKALHADHAEFWRFDCTRNRIHFELGIRYTEAALEKLRGFEMSLEDERGLVPWVVRHRTPLFLPDVLADPRWISFDPEVRSVLWMPVEHDQQLLGVLGVLSAQVNKFSAQDERLLASFANQAAVALENARLFQELHDSLSVTTRLYQLSGHLIGASTLDETAALVCRVVRDSFAADAASIQLLNVDGQVGFEHHLGLSPAFQRQVRPRLNGLTAEAYTRGGPVIVADPERLHPAIRTEGIQAAIALPLRGETGFIGVLFVDYRRQHDFPDHEVKLLSVFANQAALALERNRALSDTRQRMTELEVINRISTALRSAQTIGEMLPILLGESACAVNASGGAIWLYEPERDELVRVIERQLSASRPVLKPGEGIAGYVYASNQPYSMHDLRADPHLPEAVRAEFGPGQSGAAVPIRTTDRVVGVLSITLPTPRDITLAEMDLLTTIAEMAGNAIHRMQLHSETEHHVQRLTALHRIDLAITTSTDLNISLKVILDQIRDQLQVDAASILLLEAHSLTLSTAAGSGFRTQGFPQSRLRLGEGIAGRAALERRTFVIPDLDDSEDQLVPSPFLALEGFAAVCAVPLIAKGQVQGVLLVFQRHPFHPSREWIDFLETLAGQAAIAVDNAELFTNLQRSNLQLALAYDTTIEGWSRALDLRDKETEGHTRRVSEMVMRLARVMGMSDSELVQVRRGALLHDIGKMGIPDQILLKPGPLTEEEWKIMRMHPVFAYDLLSSIAYLRPALDIPYGHHEKWDGTGYPRGLRGEEIPLAARIFAVVDVWDALRSDRPYRAAWPEEQVYAYVRDQAGKHFDPRVVESFLAEVKPPTIQLQT